MKVELSEEDLDLIVRALAHLSDYYNATNRSDGRYLALAERLRNAERKPVESERPATTSKRKRA